MPTELTQRVDYTFHLSAVLATDNMYWNAQFEKALLNEGILLFSLSRNLSKQRLGI